MLTVVVPMAGDGSRFSSEKYGVPKPLIPVSDAQVPMFLLATGGVNVQAKYIFIVRSDQPGSDRYQDIIKENFDDYEIVYQNGKLGGAVLSTLLASHLIGQEEPLLILDSDHYAVWDLESLLASIGARELDGGILTFTSGDPGCSYIKVDDSDVIQEIVEKSVISDKASGGAYIWARGRDYLECAEMLVQLGATVNGELYISSVYREAMERGLKFTAVDAFKYFQLGTPEHLDAYTSMLDGLEFNRLITVESANEIQAPEFFVPETGIKNSIYKLNNVFRFTDLTAPTQIVRGRVFVGTYNSRFWHFLNEDMGQYEVLRHRVPGLKLVLVDGHGVTGSTNGVFSGTRYSYCEDFARIYMSDEDFSASFVDDSHFTASGSNIFFEEIYLIADHSKLIPEKAWTDLGIEAPWYSKDSEAWTGVHWDGEYGRDSWLKDGLRYLRTTILDLIGEDSNYPEKIYVSRRDAHERYQSVLADPDSHPDTVREANEREYDESLLEGHFSSLGYKVVSLEGMPYLDQAKYFHNAKKIAGLVGSGFNNFIYSKEGATLVEIQVKPNFTFNYSYIPKFVGVDLTYTLVDLRRFTSEDRDPKSLEGYLSWDQMLEILKEKEQWL